jgi:type IV pilus assembly protein PilA
MYIYNIGRSKTSKATASTVGGFTLIELLVCIVIVGVLSAIALPSYLNQAAKTRASEAKATLGTINRSQQAYRLERSTFSNDLTTLDVKISGKFYSYSVTSGNATEAVAITTSQQVGLKISSAAVAQNGDIFTQIICESISTQPLNTSATVPTGGGGAAFGCPSGYTSSQ